MKIHGKAVLPPKPIKVAIPRNDENGEPADVIIFCNPIMDYKTFQKLLPQPKPPLTITVAGEKFEDAEDSDYKRKVDRFGDLKLAWTVITSISDTPGLEWETVNINDPDTWENYRKELEDTFLPREVDLICVGVFEANLPSEERQKEAMERFTSSQVEGQLQKVMSQKDEQDSTPSGELASD